MRHIAIAVAILGAALSGSRTVTLNAQQAGWSLSGLGGQNISALVIDPLTPTTVYAGVLGGGVFKSTDAGETWNPINSGLTTLLIRALAIDPQTPTTLYAGTSGAGFFKTTDGGANWVLLDDTRMNGNFVFDIAIDPQTPSTIYVGGNGEAVLKSADGGETWVSSGPVSSQAIAIDPVTPTTLYAGTDIVVRKSVDGGASYADTPAQPFSIFDITIDPTTPSTVYVSARPWRTTDTGGVLKSTDGGASFTPVTVGVAEMARAVAIDAASPSTLYAALLPTGAPEAGAFRSTDGGASWTSINSGLESVGVRSFAIDSVATGQVYAATTGGVFVMSTTMPRAGLVVRTSGPRGGSVTSNPPGINCGIDCFESYATGSAITLTATSGPRARFSRWEGCDSESGPTCTVTMDADRIVRAHFVGGGGETAKSKVR